MKGAIIGDIVGSIYEYANIKTKNFPLFSEHCHFTDDTVLTVAIAEGLLNGGAEADFIAALQKYGRMFPHAGYGEYFWHWLNTASPQPYRSWGNGAAMRVSPVGWWGDDLATVEAVAARTAAVTHDHPEGIKGAQAVAAAIFLARTGETLADIKNYLTQRYGYNLQRSLAIIRPDYRFDVSCQGSVPEAIIAFLESTDFEDAVRNAISLGGDSDTLAAITGSIAEAAYGIPDEIVRIIPRYLPEILWDVCQQFADACAGKHGGVCPARR